MIHKTQGIVLKSIDFRETSKISTFFTHDYGKLKGVLKGIRKDPKKFGSHVDRFTVNDIVFYHYSRTDIHLISQCDLRQYYFAIRKDYKRHLAANYSLELVDAIMPVEQPNKDIYQLMLDYLEALETIRDIDKLVYIFQVKTLLYSGFSPHLDSCVRCSKKIAGKARFSMSQGGLLCINCPGETSFHLISPGTISSILHIEGSDWKKTLRLGLTAPVKKELKFILNNFLTYHLEKQLRSTRFLQ